MSSTTAPIPAYRDPSEGDVVIRTSDQVDFHVDQRRLADVSTVFADILSIPQPPSTGSAAIKKPVIDVSESSALWHKLLPLIYTDSEPLLNSNDIRDLLEACRKYQALGLRSRMRIHLFHPEILDENPMMAYVLACAGGFEDVARAAARRTLRLPIFPQDLPEFALTTGRALVQLLQYRRRCGEAAGTVIAVTAGCYCSKSATWLSTQSISPPHSLSSCRCNSASLFYNLTAGQQFPIRRSWLDYLQKVKDIVAIKPCGDNACSASLLEPVIKDAEACTSCANRIGMEAFIFSMNVKAKIEEAISEVPFVFEP